MRGGVAATASPYYQPSRVKPRHLIAEVIYPYRSGFKTQDLLDSSPVTRPLHHQAMNNMSVRYFYFIDIALWDFVQKQRMGIEFDQLLQQRKKDNYSSVVIQCKKIKLQLFIAIMKSERKFLPLD